MRKKHLLFLFVFGIIAMFTFSACDFDDGSDDFTPPEPPECIHVWDSGYEESSPSCISQGCIVYTCINCGETKYEYTPSLGHTYSDEWTVDNYSHYHAATCGCDYSRKDEARHTWDDGEVIVESTCAINGIIEYTCTVCLTTKEEPAPLLPHTYSEEWTITEIYHYHVATCGCEGVTTNREFHVMDEGVITKSPTCAEKGIRTYTCEICHATDFSYIATTDEHTWDGDGVIVEPTCREKGYTLHTCETCGKTSEDNYTEEVDHSYNSTIVEPTCTEKGYTLNTCKFCGRNYKSDYVDMVGHSNTSSIVEPTCTEQGYTLHTCTVCGNTSKDNYTDMIPHVYESTIIEPTCTARGYTRHDCTECTHHYNDNYVDKVEHPYDAVVTLPSCTSEGYTKYICPKCSHSYVGDYTEKTNHDYDVEIIKQTCTQDGIQTYTCKDCGIKSITNIGKLPHDYEKTKIDATCTEKGYTLYTCTVCGSSKNDDYTDMIEHDYEDGFCTQCGKNEYSLGLTYNLSEDGTHYIITGIGECVDTTLIIPNIHKGIPVREIAESAFEGNTNITSVVFLSGDTKQTIGNRAFYGCSELKEIDFNNVSVIGKYAFYGCGITQLKLIENVHNIDSFAFMGCGQLTSVLIGKQVMVIGNGAFASCGALSQIVVDGENETYYSLGNCIIDNVTKFVIAGCNQSVLPSDGSILGISSYTFYGCSEIEYIVIPASVTFVGQYVFAECTKLEGVCFACDKTWYKTDDGAEAYAKEGGMEFGYSTIPSWNAMFMVRNDPECYWYRI